MSNIAQNSKNSVSQMTTLISSDAVKNKVNSILGDPKRGARFITSLTAAISTNPNLAECDHSSLINSALLIESLNLSPSPQLGECYIIPFFDNKLGRKVAQFQLGYRGYIQLALRSAQYKTINVISVKEGELKKFNRVSEEIFLNEIDDKNREKLETIGYCAFIELVNGFKKTIFWSIEKMEAHALKYSNSYRAKKGYSFWETEFDQMAFKTMLRQIISKWGIMSIELQESFKKDYGKINDDGEVEYVDNVANIGNVANVENVANKTTLNFDDFESDTQKNKVDDDDDWKN